MNAIANTELSKEFTITRLIDAPRELVFAAWTDPNQLGKWWGPHGFDIPKCELEARKGGRLYLEMASDGSVGMPAGMTFVLKGEVVEYDPPARFAHTNRILEDQNGDFGLEALTTVTFTDVKGRTRMTVHEKVTKLEVRAVQALAGFEIGMVQTLDKLETFVARAKRGPKDTTRTFANPLKIDLPAGAPTIVMTRTFDAPRSLVWEAMTRPEHVARWWGPHIYLNRVDTFDMRPGGKWRITQKDAEGRTFVFHGEYREVVPEEKIVQTFGMEGMFDGRVMVETMTLTEKDGKTHYRVESRAETMAERDGMAASGMEWGANESMERLDLLLEEMAERA